MTILGVRFGGLTKEERLYLAGINCFLSSCLTLCVDEFLQHKRFDFKNIQHKDGNYIFVLKTKVHLELDPNYIKKTSRIISLISILFSSICITSLTLGILEYSRNRNSFYFIKSLFWFCVTSMGLYFFRTRDKLIGKPIGLSVLSSFHPITLLASSIIGSWYTTQRKRIQTENGTNLLN